MLNRFARWLRSAPIADAVDRRNAPVMQLLLFAYGLLLPANWAWRIAAGDFSERTRLIFAGDMLIAVLALVSIAMIRRGRFRPAIMLFLAPQILSLAITFALVGVMPQLIDPAPTMLTLAISGLVLGRGALWTVWALLMGAFAIGFTSNLRLAAEAGVPANRALRDLPAVFISYTLIAVILDRTVAALRESLAESERRGRDLRREMADRERAQSQLIHAQKMEATGRLASGIAHDFNHILDLVLGLARQRRQLRDLPPAAQADALDAALEGVETAAGRGIDLTRKLLTFSRNDLLRIEVFDAGEALDGMRPMLRQLLPPTVRLELGLPDAPASVRLDRQEFELMLLNIAANARDAMPDGGRFEVSVSRSADATIEIALRDTGHGMDEAVRRRIFEPFYSTKKADAGTGLGLSVVADLVKIAGGDVLVESEPGQGTTFRIRLPEAGPETAAEPPVSPPPDRAE